MSNSFTAVSWREHGAHVRVYSSSNGTITERGYDPDRWFTGSFTAPGESLAATAYVMNDKEHIRVYAVDNGKIAEHCWNGDSRLWTRGGFSADGKAVAAVSWVTQGNIGIVGPASHLRVYVIGPDNNLTEQCWDGEKWYKGDLEVANAAGVEAASWLTSDVATGVHFHVRVYVRDRDNNIKEYWYNGPWKVGEFSAHGTNLSATAYTKGDTVSLRIYTIDGNRQLTEHCYDGGSSEWYKGEFSLGDVNSVASTAWATGETHLRVYTKGGDGKIAERYWDDGEWHNGAFTQG